jgi:pyruvate/oxaloacetate carboxyltransferase
MLASKNSNSPKFVNLTLRDGQQSTLAQEDWIFDPADLSKVIAASHKAGFSGAEIAGGQSFQIAINCGYNPFTILNAVSHAMEYGGFRDDFQLQMLFRGANALGFRHYDKDLIEKTLQEFIKCGIDKIRFFDALNDIDNLRLPASIKSQQDIVLEGALCFTHYPDHPDRYTDAYYLNYAEALIAEGYTAIAIKDMSGQLTAERISTLVPALLEKLTSDDRNIPLTLHVHSTHHENSLGAMQQALQYGVYTIETTEGILSGGSAHHSLASISPEIIPNSEAYENLQKSIAKIWSSSPDRKDTNIPNDLKQQLCAAGVPGGAMPFVIRDLSQQQSTIRAKYQASSHTPDDKDLEKFEAIIDLFITELKQVCTDANLPLLVTPTADICCKQAIANLAFGADPHSGTLAGRYLNNSGQPNPDARFAKLILGHYGELKAYEPDTKHHAPKPEIITFFEAHNAAQLKTIPENLTAADSTADEHDRIVQGALLADAPERGPLPLLPAPRLCHGPPEPSPRPPQARRRLPRTMAVLPFPRACEPWIRSSCLSRCARGRPWIRIENTRHEHQAWMTDHERQQRGLAVRWRRAPQRGLRERDARRPHAPPPGRILLAVRLRVADLAAGHRLGRAPAGHAPTLEPALLAGQP